MGGGGAAAAPSTAQPSDLAAHVSDGTPGGPLRVGGGDGGAAEAGAIGCDAMMAVDGEGGGGAGAGGMGSGGVGGGGDGFLDFFLAGNARA
jgi:hypothetical protein